MVHDPPTEAPNTYEAPAEEEEVEETMVHPEEPVVMEQPKYAPAPYSPPKMKGKYKYYDNTLSMSLNVRILISTRF